MQYIIIKKMKIQNLTEEFELYIPITNYCNLNCLSCDHLCPIVDNQWNIDIDEYENQLINLINSKIFKYLQSVTIFGGEPLLHPNIIDILQISRKYLKTQSIGIITNGINLLDIDTNFFKTLKTNQIGLNITMYDLDKDYYNLIKEKNSEDISLVTSQARLTYGKITIDKEGKQDPIKNYQTCGKPMKHHPMITLYNNKIYMCPTNYAMNFIGINDDINDCYDIKTVTIQDLQNDLNSNKPYSKCKFCKLEPGKTSSHIWNTTSKDKKNIFFKSNKELFLNNYELYDYVMNSQNIIKKFSNNKKLIQHFDFSLDFINTSNILFRFFYSKLDICFICSNILDKNILNKYFNLIRTSYKNLNEISIYIIDNNCLNISDIYDFCVSNNDDLNIYFLKQINDNDDNNNIKKLLDKNTFSEKKCIINLKN